VGSILMVISIWSIAGPIIGMVGFMLVLIAVKSISENLGDAFIFRNMLASAILGIVGMMAIFIVLLAGLFALPLWRVLLHQPAPTTLPPGAPPYSAFGIFDFWVPVMAGLGVVWLLFIASAVFLRRSFNSMARGLKIGLFSTVGLLYLVGSALLIILVGFVVLFVGWILQAVAFFSIPEQLPGEAAAQTPQA
jgi:uncharacterized membrane protein